MQHMNVTMNVTTVDTFLVEHGGWIAADDDSDPMASGGL